MIPQTLEARLRRSQVIPFVGAGVSRSVLRRGGGEPLFPGWRDLLLGAADRLEKEGRSPEGKLVRSLLEVVPPEYLEAARRARDGLGAIWPQFLEAAIGRPFEEAEPESLSLARAVWNLGHPLVVTTNYDQVLKWAAPPALAPDLDLWDIEAKAEQVRLLQEGRPARPTVWHLHGRIGNAAELILTPDRFQRLYDGGSEGRYKAALTTFRTLLASRSLLFLGFSFDDAALGVELQGVNDLFEGTSGPHYALVHQRDMDRVRALNLPVECISFADFGAPLLALVKQLGEVAREAKDAPAGGSRSTSDPPYPRAAYSPDNRPFFVPFRAKEDRMIGRDKALQRVHEQLMHGRRTSIGQTAAFEGLGGLGKTQLAVEYAWRFGDEYPNGVIWLTADQDIAAQLTRLAVEAKWVAPESEHRVKLEVAQDRLRSFSDCLIVFDNLEARGAIEPYLPLPTAHPHLLVTSRTEQPGFVAVPLDLLDADDSVALLVSEAGRSPLGPEDEEAASNIARELGGLPLALEMAGAYLLHRPVRWHQYLELLERNPRAALHPRLLASFTRHESDLYVTLRVQEELLEEESHLREILDILTWSASAAMGLPLLSAVLNVPDTELLGALALGVQLRLLERSAEGDRYGLHRLVRKVRQEERPLEDRRPWADEVCRRLGDWFFARRRDFAALPTFEAEIDHLETWREQASFLGNAQVSRLTWLLAYPPYYRGQYADSRRRIERASALLETTGNKDRAYEASLWHDLGVIHESQGHHREALELHQRALATRREILGDEHPDTAQSLAEVATSYGNRGNWAKAVELSTRALEIRLKILGDEHHDTAASLNNLGWAYQQQGDGRKALPLFLRALEIEQKTLGEEHPLTATSLNNIGYIYDGFGEWDKGLELKVKALEILRKVHGGSHPDTIGAVLRTARSLQGLDRRTEAFELIAPYFTDPPRDPHQASQIKSLARRLKVEAFRPGFRQPPAHGKGKRKKRRRH
jgi:tetratricopeptide (TPR) repeat protein